MSLTTQQQEAWKDNRDHLSKLNIEIVSPSDNGSTGLGWKTTDLVKFLDKFGKEENCHGSTCIGLKALQELSEYVIHYNTSCGGMDYKGHLINVWVRDNEKLFLQSGHMSEDDYHRLHDDAYVYVNSYRGVCDYKTSEGRDYLKNECCGYEEAGKYNDGMEFFWMGEY